MEKIETPEVIVDGINRITWLNEKSDNVLRNLSRLYELNNNLNQDETTRESIKYELNNIMSDLMKVFLCLEGFPYGYKKNEFVDSYEKYLEFLENYNIETREKSHRNKLASDNAIYSEVVKLLDQEMPQNRSDINILIDSINIKDEKYIEIDELIDNRNMGEISWELFCYEANKLINNSVEPDVEK